MAAALGSSLPAPADATTAAPETTAAAVAPFEDHLADPVDVVLVSTLEGIKLAFSMDDPLGFTAMSPVSRESETQGEQHSRASPVASPAHVSSYMDMLFGSKTPR